MHRQATPGPGLALVYQLVPPLLLIATGLVLFSSTGRDDAHISFWPAHTLARFGHVLNYNGIALEQSSSLLQVVLAGAVERVFGGDPVAIGKVLSITAGVVSVVLIYRLALRIEPGAAPFAALFAASMPYFVYWSFGGLESTLVAAVGLALILTGGRFLDCSKFSVRDLVATAAAMCAFALVRPESTLVLACLVFGTVVVYLRVRASAKPGKLQASVETSRGQGFRAVAFGFVALLISIGLFAYRYRTFGRLFPQPVAAKSDATSPLALGLGVQYLWSEGLQGGPAIAAITIICVLGTAYVAFRYVADRVLRPYTLLSLLYVCACVAFAVAAGGDWMEGGRFLVPVLPVAALFVAMTLWRLTKSRGARAVVSILFLGAALKGSGDFAAADSTGNPVWASSALPAGYSAEQFSWFERRNRVSVRDIPTVTELSRIVGELVSRTGDRIHIFSTSMGMVPYHVTKSWFDRVQWLDRFGLSDSALTDCAHLDIPHLRTGVRISVASYLDRRFDLQSACGITPPDIVFDNNPKNVTVVEAKGFIVVYEQRGFVTSTSTAFAGTRVPAFQFIAVRNDLAARLSSANPLVVTFGDGNSK